MGKTKTQFKGVLMLTITAIVWGSSFVAQSVGMETVEAFTFMGIRTLLGALVLMPIVLFRDIKAKKTYSAEKLAEKKIADKKVWIYGALLGVVLCAASNFQQFSFYYSTSGRIAFITALYMFFVPILGLFFRKRIPLLTWICIGLGIIGLFFLCLDPAESFAINKGDILSVICAVFYAVQILMIEKFAPEVDPIKLSCIQYLFSGVISCILMLIFEDPQISAISTAVVPILYSGVMSCGLAYTMQIIGQRYTEATIASLIMCTESVFGALSGALILHEVLSGREILGCVIMFVAIVLSQLSEMITERFKTRVKN